MYIRAPAHNPSVHGSMGTYTPTPMATPYVFTGSAGYPGQTAAGGGGANAGANAGAAPGTPMILVPSQSAPHKIEKYAFRQRKQGAEMTNLFKKVR